MWVENSFFLDEKENLPDDEILFVLLLHHSIPSRMPIEQRRRITIFKSPFHFFIKILLVVTVYFV